jgi:peptidyl-prolyl cis-trans isomerase-like 1
VPLTPPAPPKTPNHSFTVELYVNEAPKATENFLGLCRKGYYDNVIFHRIIQGFMAQTGDPSGTGRGGESVWGGGKWGERTPTLRHTGAGVIAFANSGAPDSNGSQWYVTLAPCPHLDGKHTVFGRVCEGMEAVRRLGRVQTGANDRPTTEVKILRARPL